MPQNAHLEGITAEIERQPECTHAAQNRQLIPEAAAELAHTLAWLPNSPSSHTFAERSRILAHDLKPIFAALELPAPEIPTSDDFRWLYDNGRILYSDFQNTVEFLKSKAKITHVRTPSGQTIPPRAGPRRGISPDSFLRVQRAGIRFVFGSFSADHTLATKRTLDDRLGA